MNQKANPDSMCAKDLQHSADELSIAYDALNSSAAGVIITDREGRIRYLNPAFLRLFGYPERREVLGKYAHELFAGDEIRTFSDVEALIGESRGETDEFLMVRKDGSVFDVAVSSSEVTDRNGATVGRMASFVDISERKRAQEERLILATAIEAAPDAVLITDGDWRIRYANPAFHRVSGYQLPEVVGGDVFEFEGADYDPALRQSIRESLHGRGVWRNRQACRRKDGTSYLEECTFSAVKGDSGEIDYLVVTKRDVTELVRLESMSEAINIADNIGYVFSGVRHEIGNPVNAIKMTLSMLRSKLEREDNQPAVEYIKRCLEEVGKIQYLLGSLKNFSMLEEPRTQEIACGEFLEKFQSLIAGDLEKQNIGLKIEIDPGAGRCAGDPRVLQQVLLNIVTNAMDACREREQPEIGIRVSPRSERIEIRVSDNGTGMTPEQLKKVFRPFFTSKAQGTGLGLVIARRMLAKMSGSLEIESEKGAGTTATLSLPACLSSSSHPE